MTPSTNVPPSRQGEPFPRVVFAAGFLLWGLVFFSFTTVAAVLRVATGGFLLLVVVIYGDVDWEQLGAHHVLTPPLLFWGWMGVSSLGVEAFFENNYGQFWQNAGFKAVIFLVDRWNLAGILFVLACWGYVRAGGRDARRLLIGAFMIMLIIGLLGGYLPYVFRGQWRTGEHWTTFAQYYNTSAILLNVFLPFTLAGFLHARRGKALHKGGYLALFYAGLAAVFLTQSRGGFLSLLFGLTAIAAVFLRFHFSWGNLLRVALIVLVGVGLIRALPEASRQRTQQRYVESSFALSGRVTKIWPHALRLIAQRPVIGYSLGSYYPESVESDPARKNPHAHNHWLQLTFEGGLVGLGLFLWLCYRLLGRSVRMVRDSAYHNFWAVTFLTTFTASVFVHGFIEDLYSPALFALIGWFIAVPPRTANEPNLGFRPGRGEGSAW